MKIGSINLPHITVADDLAVMSRSYGSQQVKVWDVDNNTCRERYCVNPVKSSTLFYHFNRKVNNECTEILLAGDKISNDQKTPHLGIDRTLSDRPSIEEKISLGRKTAYSLMGAGFHSENGLKACLNGFIWSTFVLPRVTYGLEALILRKTDFETLEKFQRKSLKQIQGLPDNAPNVVVLALLGILPVRATIHKNSLNLFMNMTRDKSQIEYQIAERQLAMKDSDEKSWFNYIKSIIDLYDMPSVYTLLQQDISKPQWKKLLNSSINSFVEASWK